MKMLTAYVTIIFSVFPLVLFSQEKLKQTDKLASFCELYGFLKYYHPAVANGTVDWDKVFIDEMEQIDRIDTKEQLNQQYLALINSLGDIHLYPKQDTIHEVDCNFNISLKWIDTSSIFSSELKNVLQEIITHRCISKNRFVRQHSKNIKSVEFINEKPYPEMLFPNKEYRLLSLARYWNMIEYFFPYKYLTDELWDTVLTNAIPQFIAAANVNEYYSVLTLLIAKVNDSHAKLLSNSGVNNSSYCMPIMVKVFPDKAIITEILNDSLAKEDDLRVGDVILSIDGMSISDIIMKRKKYIGASNEWVIRRDLKINLINGETRIANIRFNRDEIISSKKVNRYLWNEIHYMTLKQSYAPHYMPMDNIGYINMGLLEIHEVKSVLKRFSKMSAIIFDLRTYPNMTFYKICNYLAVDKTPFVKISYPDLTFPGKFLFDKPYEFGKKKKNIYKGKIIILVNELTQSRAEFAAMALKSLPNSTIIGSHTAGADGNIVNIVLPGNYQTFMSGLGIYYPNGKETQRVGIIPDIYVEQTIEGIRNGKDEILENAILFSHK